MHKEFVHHITVAANIRSLVIVFDERGHCETAKATRSVSVAEFSRVTSIDIGFSKKAFKIRINCKRDSHLILDVGKLQSVRVRCGISYMLYVMCTTFGHMLLLTSFGGETIEAEWTRKYLSIV